MDIVTVSREFGSGGRELGKRLADELGCAYYDREIITAIAKGCDLDEKYVEQFLEKGRSTGFAVTFGRTFSYLTPLQNEAMKILIAEQKIIKELAGKGNCVIVGRGADVVLRDMQPLNLFVYADMPSKLERCRQRAGDGEQIAEAKLIKTIKRIDDGRRKHYELMSNLKWGAKEGYHLCINTSGWTIKELVPSISDYVKRYFEKSRK